MRNARIAVVFLMFVPFFACAFLTAPGRQLREADFFFRENKYHDAVARYRTVIRDNPDSSWAADAQFRLAAALAHYDNPQRDYSQALREFEEFLRLYPEHAKVNEAQNWLQVLKTLDHLNKNIEQLKRLDIKHEEKRKRR